VSDKFRLPIKFLLLQPKILLQQPYVLLTELNILFMLQNVFVMPILTNDFRIKTKLFSRAPMRRKRHIGLGDTFAG